MSLVTIFVNCNLDCENIELSNHTTPMEWPPSKSWTSSAFRNGYRHFVAINYGGKDDQRWVNLVSVLDGTSRLHLSWDELQDTSLWTVGWQKLSRQETKAVSDKYISRKENNLNESEACLHPSIDSGLNIPYESSFLREWT